MKFTKATKSQSRLRMALVGPSGSGKTYSSLAIAMHLGKRIAVIDTERGSAAKYAHKFSFDVLNLESFSPDEYVDAIHAAEAEGFDVLVIDSLSHAWMGKDGALELVDRAQARGANKFTAWKDITPKHTRLIEAIVGSRCHIIVTMRVKTEYVIEKDDKGRSVPRKIGLAPVQRDGMEYEFDVVGDIDQNNRLIITKTRCSELTDAVIEKPGEQVAKILTAWLTDGTPIIEPPPPIIDEVFESYLNTVANASSLSELDRIVTGPGKPDKGTPKHARAVGVYVKRRDELKGAA